MDNQEGATHNQDNERNQEDVGTSELHMDKENIDTQFEGDVHPEEGYAPNTSSKTPTDLRGIGKV